jgi:hypothetical protein
MISKNTKEALLKAFLTLITLPAITYLFLVVMAHLASCK